MNMNMLGFWIWQGHRGFSVNCILTIQFILNVMSSEYAKVLNLSGSKYAKVTKDSEYARVTQSSKQNAPL